MNISQNNSSLRPNTTEQSNVQNYFYDDFMTEIQQIVEVVGFAGLTTLACVIGIPGNVVNCLVFLRQGLHDRMNLCLFSLALADCLYLLCSLIMSSSVSLLKLYDIALGEEYQVKTQVAVSGFFVGIRATSGVITAMIAVDRCACVVFPLSSSTLIRTRTMGALICFTFIILQCFGPVYYLSYSVEFSKTDNKWFFSTTRFYHDFPILVKVLRDIVLDIVVRVVSFVTVCVSTAVTVQKLREARAWRQKTSLTSENISSQQAALTSMLVVVCIIYILTSAPVVTWRVVALFLPDPFTSPNFYTTFMTVSFATHSLPQINSCVHIFVFYFRSKRFRETLQGIVFRDKNQSFSKRNLQNKKAEK